jgi:sulfide:quinone oxidoreductase
VKTKTINPDFLVSPQLVAEDIVQAKAQGIRSIICNRPDGEAAGQSSMQTIRDAAENAGLEFREIPFAPGKQTEEDIAAFASALKELPAPVLAYCRTGTRSTGIWAQASVAQSDVNDIIAQAGQAGFDLSKLRDMLLQRAANTK